MKLVRGTMTFGPQVDTKGSRAMLQHFLEAGYHELDTAYVYNEGDTERILGSILNDISDDVLVLKTKSIRELSASWIQMRFTCKLVSL